MVGPIVCGVLAALIAFVLTLKLIVGDDSETRALRKRLKFHGVEPQSFSSACLTELIETQTRHLRFAECPTETALRVAINNVAIDVRNIIFGNAGFGAAEVQENVSWLILAKHDPDRFCLSNLETTQRSSCDAASKLKPPTSGVR